MFCYFREHNVFNGFNKTLKLYCCEPGFINTNFGVCFCLIFTLLLMNVNKLLNALSGFYIWAKLNERSDATMQS